MSGTWFNAAFGNRHSVVVPNAGNNAVRDASLTIPADWDDFWLHVQDTATFHDVVVVDPVLNTVIAFKRADGASFASRALVLQINNATLADTVSHVWLYWGAAEQDDRATAITFTEGAVCALELGRPGGVDLVVNAAAKVVETNPKAVLVKNTTEEREVWLDLSPLLMARKKPHNKTHGLEAIASVTLDIQRDGSSVEAMVNRNALRIVDGVLVRAPITGGTVNYDYTVIITVTLARGTQLRVYQERVLLRVRNSSEV